MNRYQFVDTRSGEVLASYDAMTENQEFFIPSNPYRKLESQCTAAELAIAEPDPASDPGIPTLLIPSHRLTVTDVSAEYEAAAAAAAQAQAEADAQAQAAADAEAQAEASAATSADPSTSSEPAASDPAPAPADPAPDPSSVS